MNELKDSTAACATEKIHKVVFDGNHSFIRSFSVRIVTIIILKMYPAYTVSSFKQTKTEVLIKLTSIFCVCTNQPPPSVLAYPVP